MAREVVLAIILSVCLQCSLAGTLVCGSERHDNCDLWRTGNVTKEGDVGLGGKDVKGFFRTTCSSNHSVIVISQWFSASKSACALSFDLQSSHEHPYVSVELIMELSGHRDRVLWSSGDKERLHQYQWDHHQVFIGSVQREFRLILELACVPHSNHTQLPFVAVDNLTLHDCFHDTFGNGAECSREKFACNASKKCLDADVLCDFNRDCSDGSDESAEDICGDMPLGTRCDFENGPCFWWWDPQSEFSETGSADGWRIIDAKSMKRSSSQKLMAEPFGKVLALSWSSLRDGESFPALKSAVFNSLEPNKLCRLRFSFYAADLWDTRIMVRVRSMDYRVAPTIVWRFGHPGVGGKRSWKRASVPLPETIEPFFFEFSGSSGMKRGTFAVDNITLSPNCFARAPYGGIASAFPGNTTISNAEDLHFVLQSCSEVSDTTESPHTRCLSPKNIQLVVRNEEERLWKIPVTGFYNLTLFGGMRMRSNEKNSGSCPPVATSGIFKLLRGEAVTFGFKKTALICNESGPSAETKCRQEPLASYIKRQERGTQTFLVYSRTGASEKDPLVSAVHSCLPGGHPVDSSFLLEEAVGNVQSAVSFKDVQDLRVFPSSFPIAQVLVKLACICPIDCQFADDLTEYSCPANSQAAWDQGYALLYLGVVMSFILICLGVIGCGFFLARNRSGKSLLSRANLRSFSAKSSSGHQSATKTTKGSQDELEMNPLYQMHASRKTCQLPEVSRRKVELRKPLGQGAFGVVYEGTLLRRNEKIAVAIKTLPQNATAEMEMDFSSEALIAGKFFHPNIVKCFGVCFVGSPKYILLELLAGGDVRSFLRSKRAAQRGVPMISMLELLEISFDIAKGCQYLEANHFIHRDIAARNCLLTTTSRNRIAKIADFGMARDVFRSEYYRKESAVLLPVKWLAPEAFAAGIYSSKSDVWSYGVFLWEVFSLGCVPYAELSNDQVMEFVGNGGTLNSPSSHCPSELYDLMAQCWKENPDSRISFSAIATTLLGMMGLSSVLSAAVPHQMDWPLPLQYQLRRKPP